MNNCMERMMTRKMMRIAAIAVISAVGLFSGIESAEAQVSVGDFAGCGSNKACQYDIVWDGHQGTLQLYANGSGWLLAGGNRHVVRARLPADPQTNVPGVSKGPGYRTDSNLHHRIVFWVDFANTPDNFGDDQPFDGYLMTQSKNAIAGVTWWRNIVFGFYAANKRPVP